jgi:hypothetical protein
VNALRAVVVVGVLMVAVPGAAADPTPVPVPRAQATALADELRLHPEAAAEDAYKFLHQGVFGPGHAIDDRQSAERLLDQEIAGLAPAAVEESLCQPLGGPTPMARIHLRPFLAADEDPHALLEVFVASAAAAAGSAADMDATLAAAVATLVKDGQWGLAGELETLGSGLAAGGYPAVGHSERYRSAFKPAYRVVVLELARAKGWCP